MIELSDAPTELTTAATNLPLGLVALVAWISFYRRRGRDPWKARVWMTAAVCFLVVSIVASGVHGLKLSEQVHFLGWTVTYLGLGLVIAAVTVGAVLDLWGERASRRVAPVMAMVALLFVLAMRVSDRLIVFIGYEAVFVGFALVAYGYLAVTRRLAGAGLLWAGLLVSLMAAVVQTTDAQVTMIWTFDHNGLFHLLQVPGLILMVLGVGSALRADRAGHQPD
jgi:Family of unknown function (DUF6962)